MTKKIEHIFVTAIGTDSGKTLVSAILCEAFGFDYWKPVQCGEPRDMETLKSFVSNKKMKFYPEAYFLKKPASPHDAAKDEKIEISISKIKESYSKLQSSTIVEGAGGLMVPLNKHDFVIDIPQQLNIPIVLVANLYLGSINHTLLSVNELKRRNLKVHGIIFNGTPNAESENIILQHSGYKKLLHIMPEKQINKNVVRKYAKFLTENQ